MICPRCRSYYVVAVTSPPTRRLQCGDCDNVWAEEPDRPPPITVRGTREQLTDVRRAIDLVLLSPATRWEGAGIVVEVVEPEAGGAQ